jgi:predicted nucleic acid-binding protein
MERNAAVVYDASILFSSSLRDLLVQLGVFAIRARLFRPRWTEQINDEWIRNIVLKYPDVNPLALERTRTLMNIAVRDCLVTGYEQLIEEIVLRDPDDRHVVAAAKKCEARIIVTFNLSDFAAVELRPHGLIAMHPDKFLSMLLEEHDDGAEISLAAAMTIQKRLRSPALTWNEYLSFLANPSGPNLQATVARMKVFSDVGPFVDDTSNFEV